MGLVLMFYSGHGTNCQTKTLSCEPAYLDLDVKYVHTLLLMSNIDALYYLCQIYTYIITYVKHLSYIKPGEHRTKIADINLPNYEDECFPWGCSCREMVTCVPVWCWRANKIHISRKCWDLFWLSVSLCGGDITRLCNTWLTLSRECITNWWVHEDCLTLVLLESSYFNSFCTKENY